MTMAERAEYDRSVAELRSGMDPSSFETAWAGGRSLNLEQAVRFAVQPDSG
jgi:hypothetical protein